MIYITGDTHGDFSRVRKFYEAFQTTKDDILIVLRDAGINYYGSGDRLQKKKLQKLPITLFCIWWGVQRG